VLTAAHVVHGASKVRVRFDADQDSEWSADVIGVLQIPDIDAALLTIMPPESVAVTPARFGRIGEHDAVLECSSVGFPLWKLRDDPTGSYRDSAHVVGPAAILANRREGTLEINVVPPERDPDPDVSPWLGMSGAAVFCNGRIIGIISKHHRSDGLGRLAVSRIDRWEERVSSAQQREMNARLGMDLWLRKLEDVIVPSPGDLVTAAYLAQVRDIAPDRLISRDAELAELTSFCAGPEAYCWWQGDPWAGKTALAAWFVLHPPAVVRVASFFITARLDDQSDSTAFTEAMIDQLAVIADEPVTIGASAAARDGLRRHLIERAAARLRERGEQLVLVVDGLDEDTGPGSGHGQASIASLLPRRPPDGVRVLVTSRKQPLLPADVPEDHSLRTCRKRELAALPFAHNLARDAENELQLRLHADGPDREIIALIAGAGGGLTVAELAELTERMQFEIRARLDTVLGRSLYSRTRYGAEDDRVYLFAHEALRRTADEILHGDLNHYRDKIHAWANKYRSLGWPEKTPRYLLRPYGRLLTASGDIQRFVVIAVDSNRHDRMLQRTGADATGLTEIVVARDHLLSETTPDLKSLALLAAEHFRITSRNRAIPAELPQAWARLGEFRHALELARGIVDSEARFAALTALAAEHTSDPGRGAELAAEAEHVVRTSLRPPDSPVHTPMPLALIPETLLTLAGLYVGHDPEHAVRLVDEAGRSPLAELGGPRVANVTALAAVGRWDSAEEAARRVTDKLEHSRALAEVAGHLASSDSVRANLLADASEEVARNLQHGKPRAFADIARAISDSDPARSALLAVIAEDAARATKEPILRIEELAYVTSALAGVDPVRAVSLAGEIEHILWPDEYSEIYGGEPQPHGVDLASISVALAAAGLPVQAARAARAIESEWDRARALANIAAELARTHPADAADLAKEAEHVARMAAAFRWSYYDSEVLAKGLIAARRLDLAEQVAAVMPSSGYQTRTLIALAKALAEASQLDHALQIARTITNSEMIPGALAAIASTLATSQPEVATELATEAGRRASDHSWLAARGRSLAEVVLALADSHPGYAAELSNDIDAFAEDLTDDDFVIILSAIAAAGQWKRAEHLANSHLFLFEHSRALKEIAGYAARTGQWKEGNRIAHAIPNAACRCLALADIAQTIASTERGQAERLLADALETALRIMDVRVRAVTLVDVTRTQLSVLGDNSETERRMRSLLAQALLTTAWWNVVPALGEMAPEAVVALHDWMRTQRSVP